MTGSRFIDAEVASVADLDLLTSALSQAGIF